MSSAELKCPVCSKALKESEYKNAASRLDKSISQKHHEQLKKDKQAHRKQVQVMAKKHQREKVAAEKARRAGKEEQGES